MDGKQQHYENLHMDNDIYTTSKHDNVPRSRAAEVALLYLYFKYLLFTYKTCYDHYFVYEVQFFKAEMLIIEKNCKLLLIITQLE